MPPSLRSLDADFHKCASQDVSRVMIGKGQPRKNLLHLMVGHAYQQFERTLRILLGVQRERGLIGAVSGFFGEPGFLFLQLAGIGQHDG